MIREISTHCDKNSANNIGANTDEYPFCPVGLENNNAMIYCLRRSGLYFQFCNILEKINSLNTRTYLLKKSKFLLKENTILICLMIIKPHFKGDVKIIER